MWRCIEGAIKHPYDEPLLLEEFPYEESDYEDEEAYYEAWDEWSYENGIHLGNLSVTNHGPGGYDNLIEMGFAAEELMCGRSLHIEHHDAEDMNYISINGDVYPSCDLSYNVMDKSVTLKKGNILNGNLTEFNEQYIAKWFEEEGLMYDITEYEYELDPELIYEKDE
jgi:hypothetical protein